MVFHGEPFSFSRSGIEHFVRAGSEPNAFNEANNFALGRNFVPTGNFIEDTPPSRIIKVLVWLWMVGSWGEGGWGSDIDTRRFIQENIFIHTQIYI